MKINCSAQSTNPQPPQRLNLNLHPSCFLQSSAVFALTRQRQASRNTNETEEPTKATVLNRCPFPVTGAQNAFVACNETKPNQSPNRIPFHRCAKRFHGSGTRMKPLLGAIMFETAQCINLVSFLHFCETMGDTFGGT